jgi:hypothetical protein
VGHPNVLTVVAAAAVARQDWAGYRVGWRAFFHRRARKRGRNGIQRGRVGAQGAARSRWRALEGQERRPGQIRAIGRGSGPGRQAWQGGRGGHRAPQGQDWRLWGLSGQASRGACARQHQFCGQAFSIRKRMVATSITGKGWAVARAGRLTTYPRRAGKVAKWMGWASPAQVASVLSNRQTSR